MNGRQFLKLVEQQGLVAPKVLEHLYQEVARQRRSVSAAIVAKFLVDRGHLTPLQARQLIGGRRVTARPNEEGEAGLPGLAPPNSQPALATVGPELDLAPLDIGTQQAGIQEAEPLPVVQPRADFADQLTPLEDPLACVLSNTRGTHLMEGTPLPPERARMPLFVFVLAIATAITLGVVLLGMVVAR